jgi:hypothetical protein
VLAYVYDFAGTGELLATRLLAPSRPAETVVLRTTRSVRAGSTPMATALRGFRQA